MRWKVLGFKLCISFPEPPGLNYLCLLTVYSMHEGTWMYKCFLFICVYCVLWSLHNFHVCPRFWSCIFSGKINSGSLARYWRCQRGLSKGQVDCPVLVMHVGICKGLLVISKSLRLIFHHAEHWKVMLSFVLNCIWLPADPPHSGQILARTLIVFPY